MAEQDHGVVQAFLEHQFHAHAFTNTMHRWYEACMAEQDQGVLQAFLEHQFNAHAFTNTMHR